MASNLRFDQMSTGNRFDLNIEKILLKDPIEVGDTVGLKISSLNGFENYIVQVDFGDESGIKTLVGDCFVFNEYSKEGTKQISIQASVISNSNRKFQTTTSVTVSPKVDNLPMNSVEISFGRVSAVGIEARVVAFGGQPYSCEVSFGDSNQKSIDSTG